MPAMVLKHFTYHSDELFIQIGAEFAEGAMPTATLICIRSFRMQNIGPKVGNFLIVNQNNIVETDINFNVF